MSRALAKQVYKITKTGIRASSGSISDNIVEGFERQGTKEFKNFIIIAKGSCGELRSQINRAYDAEWIDKATYEQMYNDCRKLAISINRFLQTLKTSSYEGSRYSKNPLQPNPNDSNHSNL